MQALKLSNNLSTASMLATALLATSLGYLLQRILLNQSSNLRSQEVEQEYGTHRLDNQASPAKVLEVVKMIPVLDECRPLGAGIKASRLPHTEECAVCGQLIAESTYLAYCELVLNHSELIIMVRTTCCAFDFPLFYEFEQSLDVFELLHEHERRQSEVSDLRLLL